VSSDTLVVIPARIGSTRFPGKVLADLGGRPVVEWCRRAAVRAGVGPVVVATEDKKVARTLRALGADVVLTSSKCASGTDRVWEAARRRMNRSIRFVLNLQGDEPFVRPATLRRVVDVLRKKPRCDIATAVVPLERRAQIQDPNVVKAAMAPDGRCLYFSRAPIPYPRGIHKNGAVGYFKHIGVYGFRKQALRRFVRFPPSPLERRESLEQLRALEKGMSIHAAVVRDETISIDTPEDLERARRFIRRRRRNILK